MIEDRKILAIVPARAGSQRLPNKNILLLNGVPLIGWTLKAAKSSKYLDAIVTTSDDEKVHKIADEMNVPVIGRPSELCTGEASSVDVVLHAVHEHHKQFDYVLLLQPTSPLRTSEHIDEAIELMVKKNADAIVSVCLAEHSPLWANTLPDDFSMKGFIREEVKNRNSQALPSYYRLNGAIYLVKVDKLEEQKSFILSDNIFAYEMEQADSVDIDTQMDFAFAELLLKMKKND